MEATLNPMGAEEDPVPSSRPGVRPMLKVAEVSVGMPPIPPVTSPRERRFSSGSSRSLARWDTTSRVVALCCGLLTVALALGIVVQLVAFSRPAIAKFGFSFLTGTTWDPVSEDFGALPVIYGTLVSSAIALLLATPFGVGTAVFLTELAPRKLRGPVSFVVEMLAAIPSVVYGLWGILVLVPLISQHLAPALQSTLGFLPLFQGPSYGYSMLTAGLVLAVMVVPYITAISREVLRTVPPELKAASYALGATPWETIWKVVLPHARVGISGGIVLALGRALGETMAVTMLIGNAFEITPSILKPGHSMAAIIANEFREATSSIYISSLVYVGLVLFLVTLAINLGARLLLRRMRGGASR